MGMVFIKRVYFESITEVYVCQKSDKENVKVNIINKSAMPGKSVDFSGLVLMKDH